MLTRREMLAAGGAALVGAAVPARAGGLSFPQVDAELMGRAKAAFARQRRSIGNARSMVVVDYARASSEERFYLVDSASGWVSAFHVAHGRGSDPGHTGYLHRFSNDLGSEASSAGGYVFAEAYDGRNGRSIRLEGLDRSNSNARARNIVVHAAPYAEPAALARLGKLGRSEGCFAVSNLTLQAVLEQLRPGTFLYCGKSAPLVFPDRPGRSALLMPAPARGH